MSIALGIALGGIATAGLMLGLLRLSRVKRRRGSGLNYLDGAAAADDLNFDAVAAEGRTDLVAGGGDFGGGGADGDWTDVVEAISN